MKTLLLVVALAMWISGVSASPTTLSHWDFVAGFPSVFSQAPDESFDSEPHVVNSKYGDSNTDTDVTFQVASIVADAPNLLKTHAKPSESFEINDSALDAFDTLVLGPNYIPEPVDANVPTPTKKPALVPSLLLTDTQVHVPAKASFPVYTQASATAPAPAPAPAHAPTQDSSLAPALVSAKVPASGQANGPSPAVVSAPSPIVVAPLSHASALSAAPAVASASSLAQKKTPIQARVPVRAPASTVLAFVAPKPSFVASKVRTSVPTSTLPPTYASASVVTPARVPTRVAANASPRTPSRPVSNHKSPGQSGLTTYYYYPVEEVPIKLKTKFKGPLSLLSVLLDMPSSDLLHLPPYLSSHNDFDRIRTVGMAMVTAFGLIRIAGFLLPVIGLGKRSLSSKWLNSDPFDAWAEQILRYIESYERNKGINANETPEN